MFAKRLLLPVVLVLAGLALVGPGAGSTAAQGSDCLAWDRAFFGEPADSQPELDRFGSGRSYSQLLEDWKEDGCLRLNHVQVLGTHNSYHVAPYPQLLELIKQFDANAALSFEYTHRPLTEQLDVLGVRQLELDVFADPGPVPLFAGPIGEVAVNGPSSVPIQTLLAPGEKVLHIQDIDYRTTCATLRACLQEIHAWSAAHPRHLPLLVMIEAKDDPLTLPSQLPGVGAVPPAAVPVPIGAAELQSIDDAIRAVFGPDQLITPDDVRGTRATLEEAILKDGWPTLNETRGRVFFALDNTDAKRDAYVTGHPSLTGRVMFTSSDPGTPEAAFIKLNEPATDASEISRLVGLGYLVRTRADADTVEARFGVTARRDAALASGAQFVSTDYPEADAALGTGYLVAVPGDEVGRCNPVVSPPGCDAARFEAAATPEPTPTGTVSPTATTTVTPPPTATPEATSTPAPSATAVPTATPTRVAPAPPATGTGAGPEGTANRTAAVAAGVVLMVIGTYEAVRRRRRHL